MNCYEKLKRKAYKGRKDSQNKNSASFAASLRSLRLDYG